VAVETGTTPSQVPDRGSEAPTGPENGSQGPSDGTGQGQEQQTASTTEVTPGQGDEDRHLSREQANYRRRMKAAETERDALRTERDSLREQVERLQTQEVERLAGAAGLSAPSDVWQFGASLDTLRTETGDIDAKTVTGLVGDILRQRPGLQAQTARIGIGRGATAAGDMRGPRVGLSQLLKP
jgi:hypothetical protein